MYNNVAEGQEDGTNGAPTAGQLLPISTAKWPKNNADSEEGDAEEEEEGGLTK